jgi:hypothetical protein
MQTRASRNNENLEKLHFVNRKLGSKLVKFDANQVEECQQQHDYLHICDFCCHLLTAQEGGL